jgi:hypothetical protein
MISYFVSSDQETFSFPTVSAKTFGPFSVEPTCTLNIACKLTDYSPTDVEKPAFHSLPSSAKIVSVTKTGSTLVIAFNGNVEDGDYTVSIFSLRGKKVYSAWVSNNGSGTYSVACSGLPHKSISAGSYVVRLSTKSLSMEKRFTVK